MLGLFSSWDPKGLHVYIAGGSSGLGLSTAILFARKGAHVSIVARRRALLDTALDSIEAVRTEDSQIFRAYSHDLGTYANSQDALRAACAAHGGRAPDVVIACAGSGKPDYVVNMTEEDISQGMVNGYWLEAWTAFAASKMMVRQRKKSARIVLVSSTLGYMSFIGWASYAPAKHALRGLADTLQSELMLYDIAIHLFSPGIMYTPGLAEENEIKPQIVKTIEENDEGVTPDQAASMLFRGIEKGQVHITSNLVGELFRCSTRGSAPKNNFIIDTILDLIAFIGVSIWRWTVARHISNHQREHLASLTQKGFFDDPPVQDN